MSYLCRLCLNETKFYMYGIIRNKYATKYFRCGYCDYIQTENPIWISEAYENPINNSDNGILIRNYQNSILVYLITKNIFKKKINTITHLDYAGGYGLLVNLTRHLGINSFWHDKHCENLFSKDHKWINNKKIDILSAFEVFEHFENAESEIENLFKLADKVIISTCLTDNNFNINWWYLDRINGQHIGFFSKKTLKFLSKKYNKYLISDGRSIHLFSDIKINKFIFILYCIFSKISFFKLKNIKI